VTTGYDGRSILTYWDYLKLEQLLGLQSGLSDKERGDLSSDEHHFIVIHQCYELWFKQILRDLGLVRDELNETSVEESQIRVIVHRLERVCEYLRLAIAQFDVMDTLATQDFLAFRDKLFPASGRQSFQFREIELLCGIELNPEADYEEHVLRHFRHLAEQSESGRRVWEKLDARRKETSLLAALHGWLYRTPIDGSWPRSGNDEDDINHIRGFIEAYLEHYERSIRLQARSMELSSQHDQNMVNVADEVESARSFLTATDVSESDQYQRSRARAALLFIECYRELPLLNLPSLLLDRLLAMEARLTLWKTRHARTVELVIGHRVGTGGTSGLPQLQDNLDQRVFTELWQVRDILIPEEQRPKLNNPTFYYFWKDAVELAGPRGG